MSDNRMSLFCLVDGEATANAFSVKVSSNDTVDDLKDLIKTKKTNDFSDIDANKLTLWRVSIPDDDDNNDDDSDDHDNDDDDSDDHDDRNDDEDSRIHLKNIPKKDKTKLKATLDLSDVFEPMSPELDLADDLSAGHQPKPLKKTKMIRVIVQRPSK
ncbi:hypothetical protein BGZ81_003632, partial [Podila clonocystis]